MIERFSFLSKIPYDQFLIKNSILGASNITNNPTQALISSVLYSGNVNLAGTIRSSQEISNAVTTSSAQTVTAINSSTGTLSNKISNVALANLFGSLMVVGAVAIASKYIGGKLDNISAGIDNISIGIDRLGSQFTEGFSLLSTKLDINNNVLSGIREQLEKIYETLKSPTVTKATEWRDLGLKRLGAGLYPEAIEAFTKSIEYESTDPIANLMLGKLYLDAVDKDFNYHNPSVAAEFFSRAVRYSWASLKEVPALKDVYIEALYLGSISTMLKASKLMNLDANSEDIPRFLRSALDLINELLKTDPLHRQGKYQKAKLNLLLGDKKQAFDLLNELIEIDSSFLFAIFRDNDFIKYSEIGRLLIRKYDKKYTSSLILLSTAFYDMVEEVKMYKLDIPEEVYEWLKNENIETKQKGLPYLQNLTLLDCINKQLDYNNIFSRANNELKVIILEYKNIWDKAYEEHLSKYSSLLKQIDMDYIHESLFPQKKLKSIEDIESCYKDLCNKKTQYPAKFDPGVIADLVELAKVSKEAGNIVRDYNNLMQLGGREFWRGIGRANYSPESFLMRYRLYTLVFFLSVAIGAILQNNAGLIFFFVTCIGGVVLANYYMLKRFKNKYYESRISWKLDNFSNDYKQFILSKLF